jgi:Spy/CpxP family protein refolding chaperone
VDRELKQLTRLLTLTTEQQAQVKTILTDQRQQIEALFNESKPAAKNGKTHQEATTDDDRQVNMEAMEKVRDAAKTIREDADTKIAATLTDDQKTKFAAWKQKQAKAFDRQERDGMPPPPPDGGDGPPPDGGGGGGAPGGGGPPGV